MLRKVSAGPKGHEISKDSQNMGGGKTKKLGNAFDTEVL